MVVHNLYVVRVFAGPAEADAPLVVDANAVLATAPAFESFQAVAGREAHDVEQVSGIELEELTAGGALDVGWQVT